MLQLVTGLQARCGFWKLNPLAQAMVVASASIDPGTLRERWKDRAAFAMWEDANILHDVVRELLHNPQIRAIVFDGNPTCADLFGQFWRGEVSVDWKVDAEHLALVRQFVDLYDGDFAYHGPQQPFWPLRIKYLE